MNTGVEASSGGHRAARRVEDEGAGGGDRCVGLDLLHHVHEQVLLPQLAL